jgi:glycosyltransferase involved in cell wall biosynthesis
VTFDPEEPAISTILVVGGTRHLNELHRARRRGVRIVQRLNGMNWVQRQKFTGVKHFIRAEINNWILTTIRRDLADRIIYQSEFSRDWWMRAHGEVRASGTVIYNGVNLADFAPMPEIPLAADRYRMLLVEGNIGNGYEQGLITAVEVARLLQNRLDRPLELMVVGKVSEGLQTEVEKKGLEILWKGVVKRTEVAAIDCSAHVFFSADVNAACPNAAIEALACGLPVIGYDTGAIPELIVDGAGEVARYVNDPWKLEAPDLHTLADAGYQVLKENATYRIAARKRAQAAFDIHEIARSYMQVLFN